MIEPYIKEEFIMAYVLNRAKTVHGLVDGYNEAGQALKAWDLIQQNCDEHPKNKS
jgi:hypothetical protein